MIYTDRAPPPDGKEVQAKRLSPNFIENNDVPIATVQAAQRFPVTLYTFACGAVCQAAETLLNRRGVPFTTVNVEDQKGAEQLMKVRRPAGARSSGRYADAKGFNEARDDVLDDGYQDTATRRDGCGRARGARRSARATPSPEVSRRSRAGRATRSSSAAPAAIRAEPRPNPVLAPTYPGDRWRFAGC